MAVYKGAASLAGQLFWRSRGRHWLMQLGASPEGGRRNLSGQEYSVLQAIRQPVLGYEVRHYGQGALWSAAATWAHEPSDQLRWSVGVGGVRRQAYDLVASDGEYLPASELSLTAGLTRTSRPQGEQASQLSLDATARFLGQDRIQGRVVYREGVQFDAVAAMARLSSEATFEATLRAIVGSRSQAFLAAFPGDSPLTLRPMRVLSGEARYLRVGTGRAVWGGVGRITASLGRERPIQNGVTGGIGPALVLRLAPNWTLRSDGTVDVGRLEALERSLPAELRGVTATLALEFVSGGR